MILLQRTVLAMLNARYAGVVGGLRTNACPPPPRRRRVEDMTAVDLRARGTVRHLHHFGCFLLQCIVVCILHIRQVALIVARVRIRLVRGRGILVAITCS
jgi:hypothetical protein